MKKLALLLAFVCALAGAQTFPVNNLTVSGTSSFTGTMSGTGLTTHDAGVNHVQTVLNVAALRALSCVPGLLYADQGYAALGDGGGGVFVCNGADTTTPDNGGSILASASTFRLYLLNNGTISVLQFGAKGDGTTVDTTPLQNAITYVTGKGIKLFVPYGASGNYAIGATLTVSAGVTIEFQNNTIKFLKKFNGNVISVTGALNKFVNIGIDGNGVNSFTGGGIVYGGNTFGNVVENPYCLNTVDSCLIFDNTSASSANGIVVHGGTLTPYNPVGASSGGPASIRLNGPSDTSPGNRTIEAVTASSQPLLDNTGMWDTHLIGGFTGTVLFAGNPNVTGATGTNACSELHIDGTYIRDGLVISGTDHTINGAITHGFYPIYSSYGVISGYSGTYGYSLTANAQNVSIGMGNEISNPIQDLTPNGLGPITNKYFKTVQPFAFAWTAPTTNPTIGNGTFNNQSYNVNGAMVSVNYQITFGTTTTLGTGGQWSFSLPFWTATTGSGGATTTATPVGTFTFFISGAWHQGIVFVSNVGATQAVSLIDSSNVIVGSGYNSGSIPTGSVLTINMTYPRN